MSPQELTAWIQIAQLLANVGIDAASKLKGMISHAHDALTPEQTQAAYDKIMADDSVRAALARQAAGG